MTPTEVFLSIMSILGPIAVGLFIRSGVKDQIKANESNISKQVKEELEKEKKLLEEKIRNEREDKLWNLKFDLYNEIYSAYSKVAYIVSDIRPKEFEKFAVGLLTLMIKCNVIFTDHKISKNIDKINEMMIPFAKTPPEGNIKDLGNPFRDSLERGLKELGLKK